MPPAPRSALFRALIPTTMMAAVLLFAFGCNRQDPQPPDTPEPTISQAPKAQALVGKPLPDFELPRFSADGAEAGMLRLSDLVDGESYVGVLFHSPSCPCAANCAEAVRKDLLGEEYADVRLIAVVSDAQQNVDWFQRDLVKQMKDGVVPYPIVMDKDRSVQELYGATRTPELFLADKDGVVRFWGAPESTLFPGTEGHRFYLKDAVDALKASKQPEVPVALPIGCLIETDRPAV